MINARRTRPTPQHSLQFRTVSIKMVIAVTDNAWLETLRGIPSLDEANFWAPTATNFKSLTEGELFLFKPKAPAPNKIVGGGVFAHASVMPWRFAWDSFGMKNGAHCAEDMHAQISKHRKEHAGNFPIACRILTQPFFFAEPDWIDVPASWSRSIVRHKIYSTAEPEGMALWQAVHDRLQEFTFTQPVEEVEEEGARFGEPRLLPTRLGQGAFRARVLDIYDRRCAVTLEKTVPVLEAAHIRPYSDGGKHENANGLLLRSDIHRLFDEGYVTVTPSFQFEVSRDIKENFSNGRDYYAMQGRKIFAPKEIMRDHREIKAFKLALAWHNDNCFKR